jgi:hypothetical protein
VFIIRLRAQPGIDEIKALRWLLKKARRLGLVAVDAVEQKEGGANPTESKTDKSANETDK